MIFLSLVSDDYLNLQKLLDIIMKLLAFLLVVFINYAMSPVNHFTRYIFVNISFVFL